MVNSKKMSKSSIAVIVLSILLVLSLILGFTGAWFTDSKNSGDGKDVTFGLVKIGAVTADAISVTNTIADVNTFAMPGSVVAVKATVINESTATIYARYKIDVKGDAAGQLKFEGADTDGYYYVEGTLAARKNIEIDKSCTIPTSLTETDLENPTIEGKKATLVLTVEVIQAANTAETAKAAFAMVNA
ncbi:MAG TPA: hypothetical protein DCZ34_02335 [Clostridiales bacterium]|nr:hypothetical protein [Clostridiales bacterium]